MKRPRILHIAQDQKFINAAKYLFEKAFPGANSFVIVKPPADPPLTYVDPWAGLEAVVISSKTANRLKERCKTADVVVLHGIDKLKGSLVHELREKEKILGIIYGAELYNEEMSGRDYLGKKSSKLNKRLLKPTLFELLKQIYRYFRYYGTRLDFTDTDMKKVFSEIKVFGSYSADPLEKWVEKGILDPGHRVVPFSYYPIEYIVKDSSLRAAGTDILLGNSASITNNHLEALDILKELDLGERKVIVPLSYGYTRYAKSIIKAGKKVLSDNFEPITDFLLIQEYNKLLSRCGIVIMNHYRSQALGNLVASLYLGAKVFMNTTSAYQYFKQLGCHIFLIDDLVEGKHDLGNLDDHKVQHNRDLLKKYFSAEVLAKGLKDGVKKHFLKGNVRSGSES